MSRKSMFNLIECNIGQFRANNFRIEIFFVVFLNISKNFRWIQQVILGIEGFISFKNNAIKTGIPNIASSLTEAKLTEILSGIELMSTAISRLLSEFKISKAKNRAHQFQSIEMWNCLSMCNWVYAIDRSIYGKNCIYNSENHAIYSQPKIVFPMNWNKLACSFQRRDLPWFQIVFVLNGKYN